MDISSFFHLVNISVHVLTGTIALLLGVAALLTVKGGKKHRKSGKIFLIFLMFVITTGLIGVFVFARNNFLLVITILSFYNGFSGYRVLQNKSNQPKLLDIGVIFISVIAVSYFLYYFKTIGMIWSPVIIYSTVGALLFLVVYDLLRYFIPKSIYQRIWLGEHIYKMIGAFSALLAAFVGTVFANYQPYIQILPTLLGFSLQIGFILSYLMRNKLSTENMG